MRPTFANRAEVTPPERPDGVAIRRLVQAGGLELTEYTAPRGFATSPSARDQTDKSGYVVSGVVEIRLDAETVTLTGGSAYAIPHGVAHQFVVREDAVIVQVRATSAAPD